MKNIFQLLLLVTVISLINTSCNNNDVIPDLTDGITGTYIGSMNVVSPSYQNTSYVVTVTKVSSTRVRITPQGSEASTWEQDIMKPSSTSVTCVVCTTNQLTFDMSHSPMTIAYNYNNSSEQFSGEKQ
ncbi:MAG: hypothetical protein POELPBGB_03655 [Bacteroidia bacterium]|nr:hypothetical protein [Bacteroidia bacterium]